MTHNKMIGQIEMRANTGEGKKKRYIVNAKIHANIPDNYGYENTPFGKKAKRSVFTDNFLDSMTRQAKAKKIYVDAEHKLSTHMNIEHHLKELGVDKEDQKKILNLVKFSEVPIAKFNGFERDPENDSVIIAKTELNPHFREVNEDHRNYFDAVWNSMVDEYINGISFDFKETKSYMKGGIPQIDDGILFGLDYVSGQALPENQIFEVAMRAAQGDLGNNGGIKMDELEQKQREINERANELAKRELALAEKEKDLQKQEDAKKQAEVDQERKDLKDSLDSMKTELEALKNAKGTETKKPIVKGKETETQTQTTEEEDLEKFRLDFRKQLWDRAQTTRQFPNREDMFGMAPRKTNPEGDLTLGALLYMQHDKDMWESYLATLSGDQKKALFSKGDFAHTKVA